MNNKSKAEGFSLAETLITLGIIGIIVAIVLPTLVKINQDRVNEARYKKAVSMLSQAAQLSMSQIESPGNITVTDWWNCQGSEDAKACYKDETHKLFKNITLEGDSLVSKMTSEEYDGIDVNPWDNVEYAFTTGDEITFGYTSDEDGLKLILDTNSANKPNELSQDLYALLVKPNGIVVDVTQTLLGSVCKNLISGEHDSFEWTECLESYDQYFIYADSDGYYTEILEDYMEEAKAICVAAGGTVEERWGYTYCNHPNYR
ncbi:hypothetical protein IJF81_01245 [bacterium]|nr:hypothetical protein [bacterium]